MKIGFLISHLGDEDLAQKFIENSNTLLKKTNGVDVIAFVSNQVKPKYNPTFAVMNLNEAFDYDGCVIASDLAMAEKLMNFPGPHRRYYYLWKLDWTHDTGRSFEELLRVFHNPNLKLIARTPDDKRVIEKCWNCKVKAVISDCDMEAFVEMVRKDEKN